MVVSDDFVFGVFPFGLAGSPDGLAAGPPDDFDQIHRLLRLLQGEGPELLARAYVGWFGADSGEGALSHIANLIDVGLAWDLVLAYRDKDGEVAAWSEFVCQVVTEFGDKLAALQITGEANLRGIPDAGDGAYPRAVEALVGGITAAADAKSAAARPVPVGFAVVPERNPADGSFWPELAAHCGRTFPACVDYIGLDMYPDVFGGRVEDAQLEGTVDALLRSLREEALPVAGIGAATPIRICESGWPTGPDRVEARQAEVLDRVLRAVHLRRHELNITHWELFALRDADSSRDGPFYRFGVVRDDYTPKPAFDRLRRTIAELRRR
jgi:hypothetical protein